MEDKYSKEVKSSRGVDILIEKAEGDDFVTIEKILTSLKLPTDSIKEYDFMLVAKLDGNIIGCVGLEKRENRGYIESLAVVKQYQKKGISVPLINSLFDFLSENEYLIAYSMFWNNNFYTHLGFEKLDPDIKQIDDIGQKEKHTHCTAYALRRPINMSEVIKETTTEKDEKTYWPIEKLRGWEKNPRGITREGLDRLKKQVESLGEYKPLLITPDGEVIGGNMRLKVYKELGWKRCWVSIVTPKDEDEKLQYALSDNDRAGFYIEDDLAQLLKDASFDLDDFRVDIGDAKDLATVIGNLNIPDGEFVEGDDVENTESSEVKDEDFGELTTYFRLGDFYCEVDTELYNKLKDKISKYADLKEFLTKLANEQS